MKVAILGASGGTGQELARQALERGHSVVAIVRDRARVKLPDGKNVHVAVADVNDAASIRGALGEGAVVLSGLGVTDRDKAGILAQGARAVLAARPSRILWLGAYGSGASAEVAGWATRKLLSMMGDRLEDKVSADSMILGAGGTVFHAGPLSNGPLSASRRTVGLDEAPRRCFPARVSRATVAAAMLDEAESPRFKGQIALPLER